DYNEADASSTKIYGVWSDNRNTQNGHPDQDAWFDVVHSAPQCGPCQVSYCQGGGFKCQFNNTCGPGGCCNYTCDVPDANCQLPDPCPPGACGCN
ncbi:MAG TPA: hypothetical protein VFW45_18675, partial [Candidatus Polarisedimenticolia bacterium]|nr:hypothetical protein [Candidatus Polarisedimenticolia bacterium]